MPVGLYLMSAFRTWMCCWTCDLWYGEPNNMDDFLFFSYLSVIVMSAKSRGKSLATAPCLEFTLILNSSIFLMRSFLSCWFVLINFVNISWRKSNFLSILFSIIGFSFVFSIGSMLLTLHHPYSSPYNRITNSRRYLFCNYILMILFMPCHVVQLSV